MYLDILVERRGDTTVSSDTGVSVLVKVFHFYYYKVFIISQTVLFFLTTTT